MLIFRYLAKEVFITLVSLTSILLLIFMSNQFVRYINRAATGNIPGMIIMKLMMLELPNLTGLLLPLGLYVSFLVAYGRLYAESEMTVLQACGYGPSQLLKHSFIMASVVALIVAVIMVWASPLIATERAKLLRATGVKPLIQTIVPGRFTGISNGLIVFYVQSVNRKHTEANNIFLARQVIKNGVTQWAVLWADHAFVETDAVSKEDYIVLKNGKEYEGVPGRADYRVANFATYKARLPQPVSLAKNDIRTTPTADLLPLINDNPRKAAELQWRLSIPIMVLTLTLIAVPLSRVNPRSGKYAKLLPAILIYFVYANFIFIARDWVKAAKVPQWLGMWWLHAAMLLVGLGLVWRNRVKLA